MEPKVILFDLAFLLGVPALIFAGLIIKPFKKFLMAVMCFSLCYPEQLSMNLMSREGYRMATRGFELGLFDMCTIALFFIMVLQPRGHRFRWFPPLTIASGIYVTLAIISWLQAPGRIPVPADVYAANTIGDYKFYDYFETGLYPLFELSKIIRGCFAYLVVVNFLRDEEHFRTLLGALLLVTFVITIEALIGRYVRGYHRISATLGHPNSLGTFMGMMGTLMFGVALFRSTFMSSGTFAIATAGAMVSVLLTISRGALSSLVLGIWLDVSSLFHRYLNFKNFVILFFGSLVALGLFFVAADTLSARFLVQQDAVSDIEYRGLYNEEAKLMAKDHFFGVGLGNFSTYSWIKYGPAVNLNEYGTPAHNLLYLTYGELGLPGLLAFLFFWLRFYSIGLPFLFRQRSTLIYAVAASATAASMIGHIQNLLQLSYRQTSIYMLNQILIGLVVAAWYIDRDTRRAEREARRLARSGAV